MKQYPARQDYKISEHIPIIFLFLSLFLVLTLLSGCSKKPEYKLSVNVSDATSWGKGAARFAELVFKRSEGRIVIKPYYNMVLASGDQMREIRLLQSGAIDFSLNSTINYTTLVPELNVFSLPFLFDDFTSVDKAVYGKAGKKIEEILDKHNLTLLGWGENGFRELTNRLRPVQYPEDIKGMKVRVCAPIYIDIFKALGANPTAMVWAEALTAFRKGVVDAQENPVVGVIIPYEIGDYHKYLTLWHYSYDALMLCCNKGLWDKFTIRDKGLLKACSYEAMAYQKLLARDGLNEGLDFLEQEKGVTITRLLPEQRGAFRSKTRPVFDAYAEQIGWDLVKTFQEAVQAD